MSRYERLCTILLSLRILLLSASNASAQFRGLYDKARRKAQENLEKATRPVSDGAASTGAVNYNFCAVQFGPNRYYSDIFTLPVQNKGGSPDPEIQREEPGQFRAFVMKKYRLNGRPTGGGGCTVGWRSEGEAKDAKRTNQENFNQMHMLNAKVIETGWKWSNTTPQEQQRQMPIPEDGVSAASSGTSEATPAASTQKPNDPGSSELAAALEQEHAKAPTYCHSNGSLGGYYDCNCFADKLLEARQRNGAHYERAAAKYILEPQLGSVVEDLDLRSCVAPGKVVAFTTKNKMNGFYGMSAERKQALITCAADKMVEHLKSDPHGQRAIDSYDKQDTTDCNQRK
jgi:hypothetical protein